MQSAEPEVTFVYKIVLDYTLLSSSRDAVYKCKNTNGETWGYHSEAYEYYCLPGHDA